MPFTITKHATIYRFSEGALASDLSYASCRNDDSNLADSPLWIMGCEHILEECAGLLLHAILLICFLFVQSEKFLKTIPSLFNCGLVEFLCKESSRR